METGVPILGAPVFFNHFEIKRPVEILLDSSADAACLRGPFPERIPPRWNDADEPEIPVTRILEEVIGQRQLHFPVGDNYTSPNRNAPELSVRSARNEILPLFP